MARQTSSNSAALLPSHRLVPVVLDPETAVLYTRTILKLTWTLALSAAAVWIFAHSTYLP